MCDSPLQAERGPDQMIHGSVPVGEKNLKRADRGLSLWRWAIGRVSAANTRPTAGGGGDWDLPKTSWAAIFPRNQLTCQGPQVPSYLGIC